MSKVRIVFPHHLFKEHGLNKGDHAFLVEEELFFNQYAFHKQKLAYHRATMKFYQNFLEDSNVKTTYIEAHSGIAEAINKIASDGYNEVEFFDPVDDWLEQRLKKACKENDLAFTVLESPLFINTNEDLKGFFKPGKKKFFQTSFYKSERTRLGILLKSDGSPEGGKWTYDTENRLKYPKDKTPPKVERPEGNEFFDEAVEYVGKHYQQNPGELSHQPLYPLDFDQAETWLDTFLSDRFSEFGPYEDAIVKEELILNHSVLTPMLNVGLLTPKQIVNAALKHARKADVPIASLEGFIRQIIGWREFIRGVYTAVGRQARTKNFFGFDRKISASFYDGTTGIEPVDDTIQKVLRTGYCHHIERLMILGNFMLLCQFDPDEVYRWFMELFIDAYDWVMVPNVYGMSQFADGGMFATKPYISSSNYILKMSNYKKGDWQKTWDGLYWNFINDHVDIFNRNPRMNMMVSLLHKMSPDKRKAHLERAEGFINSL